MIRRALASSSVSSDTFTRVSPARLSAPSRRCVAMPFVVIATSSRPSARRSLSAETMSSRSARIVGSPPVRRIFVTPARTNRRASRTISSDVRSADLGASSTPSSGMQYRHRRLHRSVSDILRYVCARPWVSRSIGATFDADADACAAAAARAASATAVATTSSSARASRSGAADAWVRARRTAALGDAAAPRSAAAGAGSAARAGRALADAASREANDAASATHRARPHARSSDAASCRPPRASVAARIRPRRRRGRGRRRGGMRVPW